MQITVYRQTDRETRGGGAIMHKAGIYDQVPEPPSSLAPEGPPLVSPEVTENKVKSKAYGFNIH